MVFIILLSGNNRKVRGLDIILSLDMKFIEFTKTAMLSILNTSKTFIRFHLLTNEDIGEKEFKVLHKIKECQIKVYKVPESCYEYLKSRKILNHLSVATYFRHFAPLLLKDVSKAIYLDSDILVLDNLSSLLNIDITPFEYVKGVEDAVSEKKMKIWDINRYINAGVLLMNLDYVRKNTEEFYDKIKYFYAQYGDKTLSGDQDMLNFMFKPNYIPIKYNLYHPFFKRDFIPTSCTQEEYYECCKSPAVIHFVGNRKPWNKETIHPFKSMWLSTYNSLIHLES